MPTPAGESPHLPSTRNQPPPTKTTPPTTKVTTDGGLIAGHMYCFGQRPGFNARVLFSPNLPQKGASKAEYQFFASKLPQFGASVGSRFETFADDAFLAAHAQIQTLRVPSFSSTKLAAPQDTHSFAGNSAFTFKNFWNRPHVDSDKGKVFCMWYPIDMVSGHIVTGAEGFQLPGGFFVIPEYRIAFEFGDSSVFQMSWSGKRLFHHTLQSEEAPSRGSDGQLVHDTRLGWSSQITSQLARAAVKAGTLQQYNTRSQCSRDIPDVEGVLRMENRKWKS